MTWGDVTGHPGLTDVRCRRDYRSLRIRTEGGTAAASDRSTCPSFGGNWGKHSAAGCARFFAPGGFHLATRKCRLSRARHGVGENGDHPGVLAGTTLGRRAAQPELARRGAACAVVRRRRPAHRPDPPGGSGFHRGVLRLLRAPRRVHRLLPGSVAASTD